jgi:hypothetical protein
VTSIFINTAVDYIRKAVVSTAGIDRLTGALPLLHFDDYLVSEPEVG